VLGVFIGERVPLEHLEGSKFFVRIDYLPEQVEVVQIGLLRLFEQEALNSLLLINSLNGCSRYLIASPHAESKIQVRIITRDVLEGLAALNLKCNTPVRYTVGLGLSRLDVSVLRFVKLG
jgi:hypothetical protein